MSKFIFPRLSDDKEFENLIADYYSNIASAKSGMVNLYGRNGQKQYGIDITIQFPGELWCIQCKNQLTMSVKDVAEVIAKCTFYEKHKFQKLIIATASSNDSHINDYIVDVNSEKKIPYSIEYLPWEKICDFIETLPSICQKYFEKLNPNDMLRDIFFELLMKYDIPAFLRLDPIVEGLEINVPTNIDLLCIELQNRLDTYVERNDILYRKICEFKEVLENYNQNLGIIMFIDESTYNRYLYFTPYNGFDSKFEEKYKVIQNYRTYLNQLLKEIKDL